VVSHHLVDLFLPAIVVCAHQCGSIYMVKKESICTRHAYNRETDVCVRTQGKQK